MTIPPVLQSRANAEALERIRREGNSVAQVREPSRPEIVTSEAGQPTLFLVDGPEVLGMLPAAFIEHQLPYHESVWGMSHTVQRGGRGIIR